MSSIEENVSGVETLQKELLLFEPSYIYDLNENEIKDYFKKLPEMNLNPIDNT